MEKSEVQARPLPVKRAWDTPALTELGDVANLTKIKYFGMNDFVGQEVSTTGS